MKKLLQFLFLAAFTSVAGNNDTLLIVMKLKDVKQVLTFNQSHTQPNELEYLWEIKIDSDNNTVTGDANGYDVALALYNRRFQSTQSYTGTIISGSSQNTFILNGNDTTYGNELFCHFRYSDTSLLIKGLKYWPELQAIDAADRFTARTYYKHATGVERDSLSDFQLPLKDNSPDLISPFIDIVSVEMPWTTVDIAESQLLQQDLKVFPNPAINDIYISGSNESELFNCEGVKVMDLNRGANDVSALPAGVYILRRFNKQKTLVISRE